MDIFLHSNIEIVSIAALIISAFFLAVASRRFHRGEFYNIVKWMTHSIGFFALYKFVEKGGAWIAEDSVFKDVIMYVEHGSLLAGVFCVFRTAYLLYTFSKLYGFKAKTP